MIIVHIKGGLGNQMFQYAFGRALEKTLGIVVKFDISDYPRQNLRTFGLTHFNTHLSLASTEEIQRLKYPFGIISKIQRFLSAKVLRKFNIGFDKTLLCPKDHTYIDGYFNSYKYFESLSPLLLVEFTPAQPLSKEAARIESIITSTSHTVSIHIRRGDYIAHKATSSLEYYTHAITYMQEKMEDPAFFVFSDDITWVKEHLVIPHAVYVSDNTIHDFEEVILMSKCSNHIISASTFSWWGAWLNTYNAKIVIAPREWPLQKGHEKDILPPSWITL